MVTRQTIIFKKSKKVLQMVQKKIQYIQLQNFMNLLDKVDFTDGALAFV